MPRPFVSILIDTYNHERFIEEAIASVIGQDLPSAYREIIVVDDGSSDRTPDLVRKWEPQVRLIRKSNGGQASAFNVGISQCRGELIAFLDGDDWWTPNKLELALQRLDADPEVGAVGHGQYEFHVGDGHLGVMVADRTYDVCLRDPQGAKLFNQLRWCLGASKITIREKVLRRILPIPEELVIGADEWIFNLAPAIAPAAILDKPLFYYRFHEGNLYHLLKQDDVKSRRYGRVQAALLQRLPPKLRQLGVKEDVISIVMEPIWVNAERIRLSIDGGWPWQTYGVERANYVFNHDEAGLGYRAFKALVLALALALPPRQFYRLQRWYSQARLRKLRRLVGDPPVTAPLLRSISRS